MSADTAGEMRAGMGQAMGGVQGEETQLHRLHESHSCSRSAGTKFVGAMQMNEGPPGLYRRRELPEVGLRILVQRAWLRL